MLNADNMSDLVAQAKGPSAGPASAAATEPAAESSGPNLVRPGLVLLGIGGVVLIAIVIGIVLALR